MVKYSKIQIIRLIRAYQKKYGKVPSNNSMKDIIKNRNAVIYMLFGTWEQAVKAAGFKPRYVREKWGTYTQPEALKQIYAENGRQDLIKTLPNEQI